MHHPEEIIAHVNKEQEKDREKFVDKSTGLEMEQAQEPQPLLEWFAEKYKEFGANLEFVTNRSQEGAQFVKGFGGIGGLLRYKVDFTNLTSADDDEDEFFSDDDDIRWFCGLLRGASAGDDGRATPRDVEGSKCRPSCGDRRGCQTHSMGGKVPQSRSGRRPRKGKWSKNPCNIVLCGGNV
jgi:hypothetical protein